MKKLFVFISIFIILLSGCSNKIKPIYIKETDFGLFKAEVIMKRAWKPIGKMTDFKLETKPDVPISSKEEFFCTYDFRYISDRRGMKSDIYNALVTHGENGEEVKDDKGNLIFVEGIYIPTIYEKNVFIKKAYIRKTRYKEEHSFLNSVELVIEEDSNYKENEHASGFNRNSIFRKNEKGEWILDHIQWDFSISWER